MVSVYGLALIMALVLNAAANVLMKVGMSKVGADGGLLRDGVVSAVKHIVTSPVLMIGLTCFGLNAAFYMFALQSKALKISIAYPLMVGGGYAIIAAIGYLYLSERLTGPQWIGVSLILAGVILVAVQTETSVAA